MSSAPPTTPRGDQTREALIEAAIEAFGRDGFAAVSTREIAKAAGANQALIGYHFRGKHGLYLAVFEHIAQQLQHRVGPIADAMQATLDDEALATLEPRERHARCLALLQRLTDGLLGVMTMDRSAAWARLILREQQAPTEAFSLLYERLFGRVLDLATRLVQRLLPTGTDEQQARLAVITVKGQVLVFRAARAGVLRHMGWQATGPAELEAIRAQVRDNLARMFPFPEART